MNNENNNTDNNMLGEIDKEEGQKVNTN